MVAEKHRAMLAGACSVFLTLAASIAYSCEQNVQELSEILFKHYLNKLPVEDIFTGMSQMRAYAIQDNFATQLQTELGAPIGYKAALTNPIAQQKFGATEPVMGYLLKDMLHKDGVRIDRKFGTRVMAEGDLVLRVADQRINCANGYAEIAKYLDAIYPFLELPDLILAKGVPLSGYVLSAINAGARFGILGTAIPISKFSDPVKQIAEIQVQLFDQHDRLLAQGNAQALMTHPFEVITWLRQHLATRNKSLKKGDLISLGSMTAFIPLRDITTLRAVYSGIPNQANSTLTVHFY